VDSTANKMRKKHGKWDTLDGVLNQIWRMLERGVRRFNDPFHWPALGTFAEGSVGLRTVILRQFTVDDRILVCHTDARAEKVREISNSARVSWLFYHPKRKVQLRISGPATLHADDEFADRQWTATKITSRLNYCAVIPPGSAIETPSSGIPDFLINKVPSLLETERGRKNFMAIAGRIESMDWLVLSRLGNRRARFDWDENGLNAKWLIP
jgi:pyridoxamine 5'-phosphate oxidase